MAVVISGMAPSCCTPSRLHGSSRLSRASSRANMPPPPPPALAKKDAQDTLFTDEEFVQALMSGQCDLLSFSDNDHLQSPSSSSSLLSLQLQAQQLCREDDACAARFQETPPPSFALDDDLEEPISDAGDMDIERLEQLFCDEENQLALFCDEEIEALCAVPEPPQQASMMQFSRPRSDDHQTGKKRTSSSSSPPWPSCIADDDDGEEAPAVPPPLALSFPPPPKKARTQTKRTSRREHGPPPLPPRRIKKAARMQTKRRGSHYHEHAAAAARAARHQDPDRLRCWQKTIAIRLLTRQFRAPELSRGRTALRCQCPELALAVELAGDEREAARGGLGCCALHQDALPEHRAWMFSSQGHAPPLVGGPGQVLVPTSSTGGGKAMVLQYVRWRRSVSLPTRFYVQRAVEKQQGARSVAA